LQCPYFPSDLAALVSHLATEGEYVTGDNAPGVHYHVAINCHQVATERSIDVGISIHDQEIAFEVFGGAQAEIAAVSPSISNGQAEGAVFPLQNRAEPSFDLDGAAEIAEVDRRTTLWNRLGPHPRPARLILRMHSGGHSGDDRPELLDQIGPRAAEPSLRRQRRLRSCDQ
jgi:hypothetical protein